MFRDELVHSVFDLGCAGDTEAYLPDGERDWQCDFGERCAAVLLLREKPLVPAKLSSDRRATRRLCPACPACHHPPPLSRPQ